MMTYKDSTLWKEAFNDKYGHHVLRERLTNAFEIAHNNASFLLDKIRIDFPSLTIHDITHVNSLWQVASIIAGKDYQLNPLEIPQDKSEMALEYEYQSSPSGL